LGSGDIVQISIFELFNEGLMYTNQFIITETGKISIPDVGVMQAAGLSESQLEEEIKQILSPNILKEPSVAVALLRSQSKLFSILGNGVPRPGRYEIPRYDYRLADALATAGGINQFNISYVYVSRPLTGQEITEQAPTSSVESETGRVEGTNGKITSPPEQLDSTRINELKELAEPKDPPNIPDTRGKNFLESPEEMMEVIAPIARRENGKDNELVIASTEMVTAEELNNDVRETSEESRTEWIFQDGKWVPVRIGPTTAPQPATGAQAAGTGAEAMPPTRIKQQAVSWDQIGTGGWQRRVLKIPADKLLGGDPRYNIVIRAGDNIHVPVDIIGEFCIMGNVNAQGFVPITGRPMTLKMAIAAAGGLGPLAWPKKCEVVRRIGKKREEIVMVDLDKIAAGEQPDFFIKPNDLINVGTHPTTRFRAVMRNAFRATYGFGFIYDRNFADRDVGTGRPFDFLF
jgi:polysaccharide export outer membrane protein